MSNPILATKLLVPPPRPGLVPRPHLLARLNAGLDLTLTLLSAPAGSGKSSLLSEWLAPPGAAIDPATGQAPVVGWISLDARDGDLASFLSYLVAALRLEPELRAIAAAALRGSSQPPGAEAFLTLLINHLAEQPGKRVLVLDDYHTIDSDAVRNALAFLLDRKPPSLHIVLATRIDPPLPLARLRAQGQISELRAADLQFTSTEAGDLLRRLMGAQLSEAQAVALNERVEGWAVGLQLAGLSLRDRDSATR